MHVNGWLAVYQPSHASTDLVGTKGAYQHTYLHTYKPFIDSSQLYTYEFFCFVFQGVLICYCFSESIDSSRFSFSEILSVCFVFQETRFLILFCFPERMDFPFLVFFFRNCGFHLFWFALKRVSILHFFCFP
jgi:hypothetical protein